MLDVFNTKYKQHTDKNDAGTSIRRFNRKSSQTYAWHNSATYAYLRYANFLHSCPFGHFCVDTDYLDSADEKIAMIYVVTAKLDSIKERWVGTKTRKKQYAFVLHLQWSDGSSSIIWRSYKDFLIFNVGY